MTCSPTAHFQISIVLQDIGFLIQAFSIVGKISEA